MSAENPTTQSTGAGLNLDFINFHFGQGFQQEKKIDPWLPGRQAQTPDFAGCQRPGNGKRPVTGNQCRTGTGQDPAAQRRSPAAVSDDTQWLPDSLVDTGIHRGVVRKDCPNAGQDG